MNMKSITLYFLSLTLFGLTLQAQITPYQVATLRTAGDASFARAIPGTAILPEVDGGVGYVLGGTGGIGEIASYQYLQGAGRSFALYHTTSRGETNYLPGFLSEDGIVAINMVDQIGREVGLRVGVEAAEETVLADVTGDWHINILQMSPEGNELDVANGTLRLFPTGIAVLDFEDEDENEDFDGSVAVADQGDISLFFYDALDEIRLLGGVNKTSLAGFASGSDALDQFILLVAFHQKSSGLTNADLSGTFSTVGWSGTGINRSGSFVVYFEFDGSGSGNVKLTDASGSIVQTIPLIYQLADDGGLTVTVGPEDEHPQVHIGSMNPGGSTINLIQEPTDRFIPQFYVGVKTDGVPLLPARPEIGQANNARLAGPYRSVIWGTVVGFGDAALSVGFGYVSTSGQGQAFGFTNDATYGPERSTLIYEVEGNGQFDGTLTTSLGQELSGIGAVASNGELFILDTFLESAQLNSFSINTRLPRGASVATLDGAYEDAFLIAQPDGSDQRVYSADSTFNGDGTGRTSLIRNGQSLEAAFSYTVNSIGEVNVTYTLPFPPMESFRRTGYIAPGGDFITWVDADPRGEGFAIGASVKDDDDFKATDFTGSYEAVSFKTDPGGDTSPEAFQTFEVKLAADGTGRFVDRANVSEDFTFTIENGQMAFSYSEEGDTFEALGTLAADRSVIVVRDLIKGGESDATAHFQVWVRLGNQGQSFFDSATPPVDGWLASTFLGPVYLEGWPWVFINEQGWWYFTGSNQGLTLAFDTELGWIFTTDEEFGSLFQFSSGQWLYWQSTDTASGQRTFYNFAEAKKVTFPLSGLN